MLFSRNSMKITFITIVCSTLFLIQCTSLKAPEAPQWANKMQELSYVMGELFPFITNYRKFNDPQNFEKIDKYVSRLSELSHTINFSESGSIVTDRKTYALPPDEDPSLQFIAAQFDDEIKRASEGLKMGHREYSRHVLNNVTSYCIRCHTRNQLGPEFPDLSLNNEVEKLSLVERAELYAATRQYENALKSYQMILVDENVAKSYPFEWEKAAKNAMAISVRVKRDPDLAIGITKQIINRPKVAMFLRQDAENWLKDLNAWKNEKPNKFNSAQEQLKFAKSLIQRGERAKNFAADNKSDVLFLRASTVLHDMLGQKGVAKNLIGEALYELGLCYESLRDFQLWTLHETYYEACVHNSPHTKLAEKCYQRLEESVFMGYTGSRGLSVPGAVYKHLEALKNLAQPEAQSNPVHNQHFNN